jgi:hypothetical protein
VSAWVSLIVLGALMGVVGQGIRVIVGVKKARDEVAALGHQGAETIEPTRLMIGLMIGAVAGVVAAIAATPGWQVSRAVLLGAAGYSGADVIEGLMARYRSSHARLPSRIGVSRRRGLRHDDNDT